MHHMPLSKHEGIVRLISELKLKVESFNFACTFLNFKLNNLLIHFITNIHFVDSLIILFLL